MTSLNDQGIYLLIFQAYTESSVESIYVATHDYMTRPDDDPSNQFFEGRLISAGELKRSMFENGGTVGKPGRTEGYFELSNADGALDAWLDYGIGGWSFFLYYLPSRTASYESRTLAFTGTLRGFTSDDLRKSIKMRIRDSLANLDRVFLTETYAGTTNSTGPTIEGDTAMLGQFKPYSIGTNIAVKAIPVNSFDLIYQGSYTSQFLVRPSDGGDVLISAGVDFPDIASLQAATTGLAGSGATIEAGEYATCVAQGVCRLGAQPAKAVTIELRSSGTVVNMSAGSVAKQILLDGGVSPSDIDDASFDLLNNTAGRLGVGIYVDNDRSVLDVVCDALNAVSATVVGRRDGKIAAVSLGTVPVTFSFNPIFEDETVIDTFTNEDLSSDSRFVLRATPDAEGDGVPAYAIRYRWGARDQLLSPGDCLSSLSPAFVEKLGKKYLDNTSTGNLGILNQQPLAQFLTFETRLSDATGAVIQCQRRFDFYGTRRDYITFTVSINRGGELELGDIIIVQPTDANGNPRYGYGVDGKRVCVIGLWHRFSNRTVEITAWG